MDTDLEGDIKPHKYMQVVGTLCAKVYGTVRITADRVRDVFITTDASTVLDVPSGMEEGEFGYRKWLIRNSSSSCGDDILDIHVQTGRELGKYKSSDRKIYST